MIMGFYSVLLLFHIYVKQILRGYCREMLTR